MLDKNMMRKLMSNVTTLSLSNIYVKCTGIFLIPFIARKFTVEEFGVLVLCQTLLGYVLSMFDTGIKKVAIRNLSAETDENFYHDFNQYFSLRGVMLLLAFIFMNFLGFLIFHKIAFRVINFVISLSLLPQIFDITWGYDALQEMKLTSLSRFIERTMYLIVAASAIYLINFKMLALAFPISYLLSAVIIWFYFKNFRVQLKWSARQIQFLKEGIVIGLSSIMATLCLTADQIMIKYYLGGEALGLYCGATKIFFVIITFGWVYSYALFPFLSKLYTENESALKHFITTVTYKLGALVGILAALLIIFSKQIIYLILSQKYISVEPVFKVLSLFLFVTFMNILYSDSLNAFGMQNKRLKITLMALILNIGLNILVIPAFGIMGAALTTVISQIVTFLWSYKILDQKFHLKTSKGILLFVMLISGLVYLTK